MYATVAYATAALLSVLSIAMDVRASQVAWLSDGHGQSIGLWKFMLGTGLQIEFPDRVICHSEPTFCAWWRTAVFLFTLSWIPEVLTLLTVLFSWATKHRRKTVYVAKWLLTASFASSAVAMLCLVAALEEIDNVLISDNWHLIGGWYLVLVSMLANIALFLFMFRFRDIVRGQEIRLASSSESSTSVSSNSSVEEDDNVSIPEDLPPEQIDFYVFTKLARRQELARRNL